MKNNPDKNQPADKAIDEAILSKLGATPISRSDDPEYKFHPKVLSFIETVEKVYDDPRAQAAMRAFFEDKTMTREEYQSLIYELFGEYD